MNLIALQEYNKFLSKIKNIKTPILNLDIKTYNDEETYKTYTEYKGEEVYIPSKNIISAINYILFTNIPNDLTKEVYEISINKTIKDMSDKDVVNTAINYINSVIDYRFDYASITNYIGKLDTKLIDYINKYGQVKFLGLSISKDFNKLVKEHLINAGEVEYINDTCYDKTDLIDILSTTKMELDKYIDNLLNNDDAINKLSYDDGIAKFLISMNNAVHERNRSVCKFFK